MSEKLIWFWIKQYGEIVNEFKAEAVLDQVDGSSIGTGPYLVQVRLEKGGCPT
jgi:hypothetical protein